MELKPANIIILLIITFIVVDMYKKDIFSSILRNRAGSICMKDNCEGFDAPVEFLVSETKYSNLHPLGESAPGSHFTTGDITNCPINGLGYHDWTKNKGCTLTPEIDAMTGLTKNTNSTASSYKIWSDHINVHGVKLNIPDFLPLGYNWSFVKDNIVKDKCPNNQFIHGFDKWNDVYCSSAVIKDSNNKVIVKLEDDGSKKNIMDGGLFHDKGYDHRMRTCPKKNQFLSGLIGSTSSGRYWTPTLECTTFKVTGPAVDYYNKVKNVVSRCKLNNDGELPTSCTDDDKQFLKDLCNSASTEVPTDMQDYLIGASTSSNNATGDVKNLISRLKLTCPRINLQDYCKDKKIPDELCVPGILESLANDCNAIGKDTNFCNYEDIEARKEECTALGEKELCNEDDINRAEMKEIARKNLEEQQKTREALIKSKKKGDKLEEARLNKMLKAQEDLAKLLLNDEEQNKPPGTGLELTLGQKLFAGLFFILLIGGLLFFAFRTPTSGSNYVQPQATIPQATIPQATTGQ